MTPVQQIFSSLMTISVTGSTKEKAAILSRLRDNTQAKQLVEIATDPYSNHWITVDPEQHQGTCVGDPASMDARFVEFLELSRKLRKRVITGDAAGDAVHGFLASCSNIAPYYEGRWYIAAINKHFNIGIAGSIISSVWPDLVSDFGVPLAESLYEQTTGLRNDDIYNTITFPLTQEPKLDGANGSLVDASAEKGGVFSRQEGQWPALMRWQRVFKQAIKNIRERTGANLNGWVLNGEFKARMHAEDPKNWNSSWGKTVAMVRAGISPTGYDPSTISDYMKKCFARGDLYYTAYDTYPYSAYVTGVYNVNYGHKSIPGTRSYMCAAIVAEMKRVDPKLQVYHIEQHIANNWDEVDALHEQFLDEQHEGSMLKPNKPCLLKRSVNIVKFKKYMYRDAIVLGVNQGTNSNRDKAGTFECYFPDADVTGKVTVRTNALKVWAWEHRDSLAGFKIEVAEQYDKLKVSKSRNPTLVRPRVDVAPESIDAVAELCRRFGYPEPDTQMAPVLFREAIASFKL